MSVIMTFMFEPAKLQMNWARASGTSILLKDGVGVFDLVASVIGIKNLRTARSGAFDHKIGQKLSLHVGFGGSFRRGSQLFPPGRLGTALQQDREELLASRPGRWLGWRRLKRTEDPHEVEIVHHVIQSDLSIGEAVVRESSGMERSSPSQRRQSPERGTTRTAARSPGWLRVSARGHALSQAGR